MSGSHASHPETFSQVSDVQTEMLWAISLTAAISVYQSGLQMTLFSNPWLLGLVSDSALLTFTPLAAARCP